MLRDTAKVCSSAQIAPVWRIAWFEYNSVCTRLGNMRHLE
jgi:hypothetical protein